LHLGCGKMVHKITPKTIRLYGIRINNKKILKDYLNALLGNTSRKIEDEEIVRITENVLKEFKERRKIPIKG